MTYLFGAVLAYGLYRVAFAIVKVAVWPAIAEDYHHWRR